MTFNGIPVGACQGPGDPSWPGALMKAVASFLTETLKALKKKIKLSKIILQSRECSSGQSPHFNLISGYITSVEPAWVTWNPTFKKDKIKKNRYL